MKKFLLVTTILSVGLNPLAFSFIPKAYAESTNSQSTQNMSAQQKKELLEKKLAAVTKRVESSLAKIEDPEEKAKAEEAFNAAQQIQNPVTQGKALVQLGKILSVSNDEKRSSLLDQYTARAEHAASAARSAQSNTNSATTSTGTDSSTSTSTSSDDESSSSTSGTSSTSSTTSTTSTTTSSSSDLKEKQDLVYQTLESQYVTSECKVMTSSQKETVQSIYDANSNSSGDTTSELALSSFETQMTNFFTDDYVPNNCTDNSSKNNNNANNNNSNGNNSGSGNNQQMCQLMQMLQTLIPAAAKALAGGSTVNDANAIGKQELEALKTNKDKIDKTQDQKKEREKQIAMVMQGLAAIAKMLSGGNGNQSGSSCNGNNNQQQTQQQQQQQLQNMPPGSSITTTTTTTTRN